MSNGIPKDWTMRPLASLADYHNGRAFKPGELSKEGLPVIRIAQINNPSAEYDCYSGSDLSEKNLVRNGDLLFSWSATLTALIWNRGDAVLNQHIFKVVEKEGVDKHFLHQLLASSIEALAEHTHGSTMKHIKKSVLSDYLVPVPELPEQQKIATILSSVDDVIEKTRAQIDKLKDLKTGMMQELLTQGIGHTEFKDSPVGRIPKTWSVSKLRDVIEHFQNGYAFSASGYVESGIPIISMASIGLDGRFKREHSKTKYWDPNDSEKLKRYVVHDGDLLIAMTDVTPGMDLIGRCCIACIARASFLNQRVGLLRVDSKKLDKFFFSYYSNGSDWRSYCKTVSGLAAQANIGTNQILDAVIPTPPIEEQKAIGEKLRSLDLCVDEQETKLTQLQLLKRGLMQDLLTGEVRVNIQEKESEVA